MFTILKQLPDGQLVEVARFDNLDEAMKLVEQLNATWPGIYVVRDSEHHDTYIPEEPVRFSRSNFRVS